MSSVKRLGKNNENLPGMIEYYNKEIRESLSKLELKGKTLGQANKEQVAWLVHYDERRAELKALVKHFQIQVDKERGKLYLKYTESYSRELSERGKDKYIDKDDEFLIINEQLLEIEELYDKFTAIVEAFKARGFALRNLVELNVHQITDTPI
jgi:PP-loop superfamily ATP-utilizing enzyme